MYIDEEYRDRLVKEKEKSISRVKKSAVVTAVGFALGALTMLIPPAAAGMFIVELGITIVSAMAGLGAVWTGYFGLQARAASKKVKQYDKSVAEELAREAAYQREAERRAEAEAVKDSEKTIEPSKEEIAELESTTRVEAPSREEQTTPVISTPSQGDDGGRTL